MAKDLHPDEYADIMVEALRPATIGRNDLVLGYRISDLDDVERETSVLFRARGFQKVDRLIAIDGLIADLWFGDGELFALEHDQVRCFKDGAFKTAPPPEKLPIEGCKSLAGSSRSELYAVGKGIARFDGKTWTKIDLGALADESLQLNVAAVHDGKLYAAGDGGVVLELAGKKVRRIETPAAGMSIIEMNVSKKGILSLAGRSGTCVQGPVDKLVSLKKHEDVEDFVGVAEYKDAFYWSGVGDGHGVGVFVQKGKSMDPCFGDLCAELRADGGYLFGTGEGVVFQFDGEEWKGIVLDYDESAQQWKAEPGEFGDDDGPDDDDD